MIRNLVLFILLLGVGCGSAAAKQSAEQGGIDAAMLQRLKSAYEETSQRKAVRNALATTSIAVLAENADNAAMCDTHFSHRVKTKGITDQRSSGRCWLFTGLNVLRAAAWERHELASFEFSPNYCSFYDLLEKANLFLQLVIDTRREPIDSRKVEWLLKHPIGDGGQFTGVANLIMKYGVVPKGVMPETYQSNNTRHMRTILSLSLRESALRLRRSEEKDLQPLKELALAEVYSILVKCLGNPPTEFEWTHYGKNGKKISTKTYTPQSFYAEFFGDDLARGYVMLMNDPTREYNKVYRIDCDRHLYDGDDWLYVNLPIERIKEIAIASIKANKAMYFSCDVGKYLNRTKGTLDVANFDYESLFEASFSMDKRDRILTHASGSSHAMTLIAVDLAEDGSPRKWMVENSWGTKSGYQGNLIMTDKWFDEYMFRLVAAREFVPEDVLKMLEQKPTLLPAWDPMFADEE